MEDDGGDGGANGGVPRRRKPEWKDDGWPPAMSDPWGGPGGASGKKRAGGEGGSSGDGDGEREGAPSSPQLLWVVTLVKLGKK